MTIQPALTVIQFDNIHCQSCVVSVRGIVKGLDTKATLSNVDVSLAERTLSITHPVAFDLKLLLKQLYGAGFDVEIKSSATATSKPGPSRWWTTYLKRAFRRTSSEHEARHKEICMACQTEKGDVAVTPSIKKEDLRESTFMLEGVTCSSCTATISNRLSPENNAGIYSSRVTEIPPSAVVVHNNSIAAVDTVKEIIEDTGYGAELVSSKSIASTMASSSAYKVILSIEGMTCSSCTTSVTAAMETVPGVSSIMIDLIGGSGSLIVQNKEDAEMVRNEIEDAGFDCAIANIVKMDDAKGSETEYRTVTIQVDGMFCCECVKKVETCLHNLSSLHPLSFTPFSLSNPKFSVTYRPSAPAFTIRNITSAISSLNFTARALSPTSLEDRAALTRLRKERRILLLVTIAFVFAIPTFIIAVVGMSLLKRSNSFRMHLESPTWGNATLGTILLFTLATPVQFGVGTYFYTHAWRNLRGVWRKRNGPQVRPWKTWMERLFRWGSMDTLVVLGTTVGYAASLALMVLDVRTQPMQGMMGGEMAWFDSSVFLMLFILCGRYLESLTKHRTSSAITALASTLPSTGLLLSPSSPSLAPITTPTPLLEIGDTLLVPVGSSPPLDGTVSASSAPVSFIESSLTGESRPVSKSPNDPLYAGTINAGPNAATMVVTSLPGQTMLDGIVGVVRDAIGRKAGIEKIADIVTAWFVPFVVGVASLTFAVWCLRGYVVQDLPSEWLDSGRGGSWALFAVQFGVAVLVVACPCGIGLAGPTAQMVGIGLGAQHGVLSNGGGEAFHALSSGVDAVIMDKTGTITQGKVCVDDNGFRMFSRPVTTSDDSVSQSAAHKVSNETLSLAMIRATENASTHPVAVGVREWCETSLSGRAGIPAVELVSSEEIPGKGIVTTLTWKFGHVTETEPVGQKGENKLKLEGYKASGPSCADQVVIKVELAAGNEKLMKDVKAVYPEEIIADDAERELQGWRTNGKSIVLVSARVVSEASSAVFLREVSHLTTTHRIIAQLGVHDPPRSEAKLFVSELCKLGIETWMLTGDNEVTARTVAQSVGIENAKVIAGTLPNEKQEWVRRIQEGKAVGQKEEPNAAQVPKRKLVAFIGDGINDAPALAQADVSLAMGSGSKIALSTASFTLLSTHTPLLSFLTIHYIARITRRKILTNFIWACVYNVSLIPLAAGAFYEIGGKRTTLPPVWASAAMAASSVSVVLNSLALRWRFKEPGVVRKWRAQGNDCEV